MFIDEPFPLCIAFGSIGGHAFSTDVVTLRSGAESRNAAWSEMRCEYDASMGCKTQVNFELLRAHFLAVGRGRLNTFPFRDHLDDEVLDADGRLVELTSTTFQLIKRYAIGGEVYERLIRLPRSTGFVLRNNGTPMSGGSYSLATDGTGVVTIASSPDVEDLTWSGDFDVLARYDVDVLKASIRDRKADGSYLIDWPQPVRIVEVLEP